MADDPKKLPLVDHSHDVQVLRDIKVPDKFYQRLLTKIDVIDKLFGGDKMPGILPGASVLVTGMPGAGKSTGFLQILDLLQREAGQSILLNVGEESEFMVKLRRDRLGIDGNIALSKFEDVNDLIAYARKNGVTALMQDSVQTLEDREFEEKGDQTVHTIIGKKLHKLSKDTDITVFMINHVTKGGDFAGQMKLKHIVDVHAHLRLNPDTAARELILTKNRFGPSLIPYEVNLTERGLDFAAGRQLAPESEGKAPTGARARHDAIEKLIKDQLLAGEKISAASWSRFKDPGSGKVGVEVSTNVWNACVERVRRQLESEGHIFGETKMTGGPDNRPGPTRYIYIET